MVKTRKKHRDVLPRWSVKGICNGSIELAEPAWTNRLGAPDLRALTPLIHMHINPYGWFELDLTTRLALKWWRNNGRIQSKDEQRVMHGAALLAVTLRLTVKIWDLAC